MEKFTVKSFIIVGGGTDAGGWEIVIGPDGKLIIKRIPGWNPEGIAELARAVDIISSAVQLKTPHVGQEIVQNALEVVQKEAAHYATQGSMLIVRG